MAARKKVNTTSCSNACPELSDFQSLSYRYNLITRAFNFPTYFLDGVYDCLTEYGLPHLL
jgi:hypothetical protein